MGTKELSLPVFGRSHISSQRGNQEVFQEEHWQLVRRGVRGSAGPWKALSLSERTRPSQPVWPNPYEVHEAIQDTVVLHNGSRFSVHRWLLREWLGGVRLFLGSSNLRDLETPRGVGEQDHFGATTVVLTLFRKDSEAVIYSGLFKFLLLLFEKKSATERIITVSTLLWQHHPQPQLPACTQLWGSRVAISPPELELSVALLHCKLRG